MEPEKPPKTLFEYFYKLFAMKHVELSKEELSRKAIRQWIALSNEDIEYLKRKFDESNKVYDDKYGEFLKECRPYLKRKHIRVNEIAKRPNTGNEVLENRIHSEICDSPELCPNEELHNSIQIQNCVDATYEECRNNNWSETTPRVPIPAPPPKKAQELYEIIMSTFGIDKTWKQLSTAQRSHYSSAMKQLRKTYIQKYREYLMSCSTEGLHQLYNEEIAKYSQSM